MIFAGIHLFQKSLLLPLPSKRRFYDEFYLYGCRQPEVPEKGQAAGNAVQVVIFKIFNRFFIVIFVSLIILGIRVKDNKSA